MKFMHEKSENVPLYIKVNHFETYETRILKVTSKIEF